MTMLRIALGVGPTDRRAVFALSGEVSRSAAALGLGVVSNRASHSARSASRYVRLRDAGGRIWLIRISDHCMPARSDHPLPHLDFVSRDGKSGVPECTAFLRTIAQGTAQWFDSSDLSHRRNYRKHHRRRSK